MENEDFLVLDLYDYHGKRLCPLYDSTAAVSGQAANVYITTERNGWRELSFTLPYYMETAEGRQKNFRVDCLKADYKIRCLEQGSLSDDGSVKQADWFLVSEPKIQHNSQLKTVTVTAGHVSQLLKTKNLALEFSDDEGNNVGTAATLLAAILEGTGWEVGNVATFLEKDGKTEKIRSLKASAKTGAFKLITSMCDLFEAKPVYHAEVWDEEGRVHRTVDIQPLNPFSDPGTGNLPDVVADDVVELQYLET